MFRGFRVSAIELADFLLFSGPAGKENLMQWVSKESKCQFSTWLLLGGPVGDRRLMSSNVNLSFAGYTITYVRTPNPPDQNGNLGILSVKATGQTN